jgi:hypothetical protein
VGRYQPKQRQSSCLKCETGKHQIKTHQTTCDLCPPGRFNPKEEISLPPSPVGRQPMLLEPNTMQERHGVDDRHQQAIDGEASYNAEGHKREDQPLGCPGCPVGRYNPKWGQNVCVVCEAGKYQDDSHQTKCLLCPEGRYGDKTESGSRLCAGPCAAGNYGIAKGMTTPQCSGSCSNVTAEALGVNANQCKGVKIYAPHEGTLRGSTGQAVMPRRENILATNEDHPKLGMSHGKYIAHGGTASAEAFPASTGATDDTVTAEAAKGRADGVRSVTEETVR